MDTSQPTAGLSRDELLDAVAKIALALQRADSTLHAEFLSILEDRKRLVEENEKLETALRDCAKNPDSARRIVSLVLPSCSPND